MKDSPKMQKFSVKAIFHWLIAFFIALIFAFAVFFYEKNNFSLEFSNARMICDACFVTSVIFISFGALTFVSQNGGFDALRYATIKFLDTIRHPNPDDRAEKETYYDYVKSKRRQKKHNVLYLFIIGGFFLLLSLILIPFA